MSKYRIKKYRNPNTEYTWYVIQKRWLGIFWSTLKPHRNEFELFPGDYFWGSDTLREATEKIRELIKHKKEEKVITSEIMIEYDKFGNPSI